MNGTFIFLNKNSYTKDGSYRCYSSFADVSGNVLSFNSSVYQGEFPDAFSVCSVDFEVQQFGNNSSFILKDIKVTGSLVESMKG